MYRYLFWTYCDFVDSKWLKRKQADCNLISAVNVIFAQNQASNVLIKYVYTILEPGVFADVPNLSRLYLDGNYLKEVDSETFKDMPNLRLLGLRHNEFEAISEDFFSNLPDLQTLEMGHNFKLNALYPDSFKVNFIFGTSIGF